MSIEHIPVVSQDSEQVAVPVEVHDKLVTDPGQAEYMAYTEDRIRENLQNMGEKAARYAADNSSYYRQLAEVVEENKRLNEEFMPNDVDRAGEDYRALMDIVNEIRSRGEGASTPEELEAKEKMEEALQRALVAGGIIGGTHTLLLNPKSFAELPDLRAASGYAEQAGGRR